MTQDITKYMCMSRYRDGIDSLLYYGRYHIFDSENP